MKESKIKNLLQDYLEGHTSVKDEQSLFDQLQDFESSATAWGTFVKKNKILPPKDFNDTLWKSFQSEKRKKRKIGLVIMSVAASVFLLISVFTNTLSRPELSYAEKEALLQQALSMFPTSAQDKVERNIIYENEMIIVYTSPE